ncbi:PGF-pre-PGF domain-containing protein [archaeon]|jgi:PGF-pre-PGF domain-containing protein|nr:PGF-pre-PGF domain-containing protein [archaeon]MBT6698328.1 PGF-pre-PGF domain-containing protein [archaeon]
MNFKHTIIFLIVALSSLLFVYAAGFEDVYVVAPTSFQNISGSVLLNATVNGTDDTNNATNMTFAFYNSTTGALVYNITVNTADDVEFNLTYNTTINTTAVLTDGTYNLTVNASNATHSNITNNSFVLITVDNTAPLITTFTNPQILDNFTSGLEVFNVTVTGGVTDVSSVVFNITNGTEADVSLTAGAIADESAWNATLNVSFLTEGNHTFHVIANDTVLNQNATESTSFIVDRSAPNVTLRTATFSTSDTTPTVSMNFTDALFAEASCTLYMGGTATVTNSSVMNNTNTNLTVTSALSAAEYFTEVNCTDGSGNIGNSSSITITIDAVAAATTSSSGSSGGGSRGSSSGVSAGSNVYHKEIWTSVDEGETANIELDVDSVAVTSISFEALETIWGAWVKIEGTDIDELPTKVGEVDSTVHSYFEVSKSNSVKNNLLEDIELDFQIEEEWLNENGLDATQIALYHFDDKDDDAIWERLETSYNGKDGEFAYYQAMTPGFSYFAIAQDESVEVEEETTTESEVEEETTTESEEDFGLVEEDSSGLKSWFTVAIVIVVLLAIWLFVSSLKSKNAGKPSTRKKKKK